MKYLTCALGLLLSFLALACREGAEPPAADAPASALASTSQAVCATSDSDAIRLALEPTCQACHGSGTNKPFFASLDAFETLLAYNPSYVVRGKPDESKLVALLEGTAQGTYTQMPLGDQPYAKLPAGTQRVSMEAIRSWIQNLPEIDPSKNGPSASAVTTRRLRVGEFTAALQRTLGYAEVGAVEANDCGPDDLWIRDPDKPGEIHYWSAPFLRTWSVLGGGSSLARVQDDAIWSPGALRVAAEFSLGWCAAAVVRPNSVIFRDATPSDTLAMGRDKIRKNIGYLHLRLLGEPATTADLDAYVDGLFAPAEPRGATVAWTEVCAALVRDPRFLSF